MKHPCSLLALVSAATGAVACGGNVVVDGTGGGATTTGSSVTGATTTASTATSTSAGTSTSGMPCMGELTVQVDNGAAMQLDSLCSDLPSNPQMVTSAVGYLVQGGPPPGVSILTIEACAGSEALELSATGVEGPGDFTSGNASFSDGQGNTWVSMGVKFDLTVTTVAPVGGTIGGSFASLVFGDVAPGMHFITGSFQVCHTPDEDAP